MQLWSRGPGKTELNMDFRNYQVKRDTAADNVYYIPVAWLLAVRVYRRQLDC